MKVQLTTNGTLLRSRKDPVSYTHLDVYKRQDVECVIIGDGDEIVAQYPQAQETITSNERIILLSDASTLTMPDMKGWTRKDVTCLLYTSRCV